VHGVHELDRARHGVGIVAAVWWVGAVDVARHPATGVRGVAVDRDVRRVVDAGASCSGWRRPAGSMLGRSPGRRRDEAPTRKSLRTLSAAESRPTPSSPHREPNTAFPIVAEKPRHQPCEAPPVVRVTSDAVGPSPLSARRATRQGAGRRCYFWILPSMVPYSPMRIECSETPGATSTRPTGWAWIRIRAVPVALPKRPNPPLK
jgi:hypothetical protein